MSGFELEGFLPYLLTLAAGRLSRRFAALYAAEAGLSNPEWRVLAHLAQGQPLSVRDIHLRADMDKSKVSRAAARLEEAGLVAKRGAAEDRRLVALSLTAEGEALMARLGEIAAAFQEELVAELGAEAEPLRVALVRLIGDEQEDASGNFGERQAV